MIGFSGNTFSQCNYSISLYDSYGDGWNGGRVSVYVNGSLVIDQLTIENGSGPEVTPFSVNTGDEITTLYTAGIWESENEYSILDADGIAVAQQGLSGTVPGNILSGTLFANCSACPAPINLGADYVFENSAVLNWQENGSATVWNIQYGNYGFAFGTGTIINNVTSQVYTLSGLSVSSTYSFYVQADCGSEQSNWAGPYTFTTITPPVTNPSACGLNYSVEDGYSVCLDTYIDVNGLYGTSLGTDVFVDKVNIIIEAPDVSVITFSLTSPNQVTIPVSYWNGTGSNYGIIDGTCTQYSSFSMSGPDGTCNAATAPFLGNYTPENSFTGWYDGSDPNGAWRLRICVDPGGEMAHLQYVGIEFEDLAAPQAEIVINEIDVDQNVDTLEFVELYDGGIGNISLNGYTIAFYNGSTNQIYNVFDLDGYSTDENGYFVLGNTAIAQASLNFANGNLQDGADAVALYIDDAVNLAVGTFVTTNNLSDAIVYGTDDATDDDLLPLLNPGQNQVDEDAYGLKKYHSCSRIPNGSGGFRNTDTFEPATPTPGAVNEGAVHLIYSNNTFTENIANDGSISNTIEVELQNQTFALSGTLTAGVAYNSLNVPAGLNLIVNANTDTTLQIDLVGNANSHIESDDVSNLQIVFLDAVYNGSTANTVVNNSYSLNVDFFDTPPATLLWLSDTFYEDQTSDDGSFNTTVDLELISETFSIPSGNLTYFTSNNVPSGLTVSIVVTDNQHASISLIGQALSHNEIDDISNLQIVFTDEAFTGGSAVSVNGYDKSDIVVDFYQFFETGTDILSYSFAQQTSSAVIDNINHTVEIEVGAGTNIYNLVAQFILSAGASAYVNSNLQNSGLSPNNFGLPVTYHVVAEDATTTQDWLVTVYLASKINEVQITNNVLVYPNPIKEKLNIEIENFDVQNISLYNLYGQIVITIQRPKSNMQIDVSELTNGVYVLKLETSVGTINKKITIEK